jgi:hypothetical protein
LRARISLIFIGIDFDFDDDVDFAVDVDFDVPVLKRPPVFGDGKFRLFEIFHPQKLSWGDSRGGL